MLLSTDRYIYKLLYRMDEKMITLVKKKTNQTETKPIKMGVK